MNLSARTILATLAAGTLACGTSPELVTPRLVLLYATCTVNKHMLSPYDPEVVYTPNLGVFAERSVVFERHQTEAGQSSIAFASIFSGMQSDGHGVFTMPQRIAPNVRLVTEVFRDAGWDVHSWLAHPMASARLRYAQGVPEANRSSRMLSSDDPRFSSVLARLVADPAYLAFLVTNFTVTHGPYRGTLLASFCEKFPGECEVVVEPWFEPLRQIYYANPIALSYDLETTAARLDLGPDQIEQLARVLEVLYKADLFRLDHLFERVVRAIDEAGLRGETLIVFTADHGEVLDRESAIFPWWHSQMLATEVLSVPLLVSAPGVSPGRYENVTRSIDVLPTIASLAGVPVHPIDGLNLAPALRDGMKPPSPIAYSHTAVIPAPIYRKLATTPRFLRYYPRVDPELMWVSLREADRVVKLRSLDGGDFAPSVYDLASDPWEARDLFDPNDDDQLRLVAELSAYKQRLLATHRGAELPDRDPSEDEQELLLRSLGYIE